ncbi:uncharacterized protein LOC141618069 [Silene latifolia]|uniref:uncharacterized protein LOC141618069 n=1 Tax=Silene latifolia TaxID=37657 RepID=UPI003D775806
MVYAFNGIHEREHLWDNLRKSANMVAGPWAIAGDFNCVLNVSERVGGNTPSAARGKNLQRIDGFLVNKDWCDKFPDIYAHFLPEGLLDHTPCLLKSTSQGQGKRSFKYFNMWGASNKFIPLVRMHWDSGVTGTSMFRLAKNLKNMKHVLKELNKECYSDIENAATILQKQVEGLQEVINRDPTDIQSITEEYEATLKLQELNKAKESFLSQKSKQMWIRDGDANSSYFHGMLKKRRNLNRVAMIEDMEGNVCDTQDQIQEAFIDYYQVLLGTSKETKKIHRKIIAQGPRCNADHWHSLRKPHKQLLKQINATNITLIPKCDRPKSVLQFRPIACCNVVYKIISKLLCSRLAEVLPQIVGQNQGAFIQQRSIQENILICQDLIRLYERPHASPRCMFKIDLQKAYDPVKWAFVENLLVELNFPPEFKAMLMQCITTTTYSLSVNGEMFGYFQGKRGLRQGDPLSPLLFTLCMEYLTRTLQYATSKYDFMFHPMCKKQRLTSLMFADDVVLFSKGDATSMMLLLQSFATFSNATGLRLKSEILRDIWFLEGSIPFDTLVCPYKLQGLKSKTVNASWIKFVVGFMDMVQGSSLMQEGCKRVVEELINKTSWAFPLRDVMNWCMHRPGTMLQRGVQVAMMLSLMYHVWKQRNKGRYENVLLRPDRVAGNIMEEMRFRVRARDRTVMTIAEKEWLNRMRLIE